MWKLITSIDSIITRKPFKKKESICLTSHVKNTVSVSVSVSIRIIMHCILTSSFTGYIVKKWNTYLSHLLRHIFSLPLRFLFYHPIFLHQYKRKRRKKIRWIEKMGCGPKPNIRQNLPSRISDSLSISLYSLSCLLPSTSFILVASFSHDESEPGMSQSVVYSEDFETKG